MTPPKPDGSLRFDVVSLVEHSSRPMLVLSVTLILASVAVWFVAIVKFRQLERLERAEDDLERAAELQSSPHNLVAFLQGHPSAIGSRLLASFIQRRPSPDLVDSETDYLLTREAKRVFSGLTLLASVATAAPLAGLFGTVYGIMEAFAWIGVHKSASLEVVAPAIGDALVTTILGLFAAIPAVIAYNLLSRKGEQLVDESRAFARAWLRRILTPLG